MDVNNTANLYQLAMRYLGNHEDCQDVVHDVVIKVHLLPNKRNNEAYLYTVTKNLCLDRIKKKKPELMEVLPVRSCVIDYDSKEDMDIVKDSLHVLSSDSRTVFELRFLDEYSNEEIAEMLDLNVNTVRVSLSRSRSKINRCINELHKYHVEA
jgi:RNA polymerase sigma factor (sigma-70 family)